MDTDIDIEIDIDQDTGIDTHTVEARKLEYNRPLVSKPKTRRNTGINYPKSIF